MRIAYLNALYPPHMRGGAELVLKTQAEIMAARGHEVTVLTIGPAPAPSLLEERINGVTVLRSGFRNRYFHGLGAAPPAAARLLWHLRDRDNQGMAQDARELLRRVGPEVVCCHNLSGWSVAVWAVLRELGIPTAQVLHDQYLLCANCMMFRRGCNCARQCALCRLLRTHHAARSAQVDAVVGVSRYVLQKLLDAGYFARVPIREVLYNTGVGPLPPSAPRAPRPAPVRSGEPAVRFGFIGTLADCKGIELLLRAVVQSQRRDIRLLVAGRGESAYESALRARYVDERIEFLGFVRPEEFFDAIDVTVVPSLWNDTLPSVVFESLGAGVPVLASCRGGIPEMIRDGVNGLLFEPERPGALRAGLQRFVDEPSLASRLGANCRASAAPFFDPAGWAARHEALLEATMDVARARTHRGAAQTAAGVAARARAMSCEG